MTTLFGCLAYEAPHGAVQIHHLGHDRLLFVELLAKLARRDLHHDASIVQNINTKNMFNLV